MDVLENKIFSDLNKSDIKLLQKYIQTEEYAEGDTIITVNDDNTDLFILVTGTAEAVTRIKDLKLTHTHKTFYPGDVFGELAFITKRKRMVDVLAKTDVIAAKLSSRFFLEHPKISSNIQSKIMGNIFDRIQESNEKQIGSFKKEINMLTERQYRNQLLVSVIFIFSAALIINHLVMTSFHVDIHSKIFSGVYLMVIMLPLFVIIHKNRIPIKTIGISKENLKRSIAEGVISAVILSMVVIFFYYHPFTPRKMYLSHSEILMIFADPYNYTYIYHVTLQQFIRTYFQNSIHSMFNDEYWIKSTLASSFCFSVLHIHLGFLAVVATFLIGILFAMLYIRDKNIIGLIIIQFFVGILIFRLNIF